MPTKQNSSAPSASQLILRKTLAVGFALLSATLAAEAGQGPQPGICHRACWGARAPNCGISQMGALTRAIIHHTAGTGDYTTAQDPTKIRAIQNFHMDSKGWCDIAYHFLVNAGGHIYEGRNGSIGGLPRGTHDGNNSDSFGFNVTGYYHPPYNQAFTSAARSSLEAVIAWRMPSAWSPYGSGPYNGNTVGFLDGHYKVKATACPGDGIIPSIAGIRNGVNTRKNPPPPPPAKNRIDIVVRGGGNQTYHKFYQSDLGWSGFTSIGGVSSDDPAIASRGPGRLDALVRGADNGLYHNWAGYGVWQLNGNWANIGGALSSGPDAVSWDSTRVDVVARGGGNQIYHKFYHDAYGWVPVGSWEVLGGNATSDPTICSWAVGRLDVFWRGADNALMHTLQNSGGAWSGIENLGGVLTSAPDAVCWGSGRIDVVARGSNNQILHKWYVSGSTWTGWEDLGGTATSDPTICSWELGRLDIFWRGAANDLRHKWYVSGSGWSGEESLGGVLTSGPDSVAGKW